MGFEFVSRFRAIPAGRDIPIIVWTVKDLDAGERRRLQPSITALRVQERGRLARARQERVGSCSLIACAKGDSWRVTRS